MKSKYIWKKIYVIPLFPLVVVNNCQSIIHMPKIMIKIYTTNEQINQFPIDYMIKPSL